MTPLQSRRLGRGLVLTVAALLLLDALAQFASPPFIVAALEEIGFPPDVGPRLALVTLACALLLALPRTAPAGAVLMTGFLGGAICAHFRIGEIASQQQLICFGLAAAAWTGLMLADPRLRALLPTAAPPPAPGGPV